LAGALVVEELTDMPNDLHIRVPLSIRGEQRIRELEDALKHARAVADAERRRADLLERTAQDAYRRAAVNRVHTSAGQDRER
jgi:hypothetical protein